MYKRLFLAVFLGCTITSCENRNSDLSVSKQIDHTQTTVSETSATKEWYVGKQFGNTQIVSPNAEEGGPDFMQINEDHTANFKRGDIVNQMSWEVKK